MYAAQTIAQNREKGCRLSILFLLRLDHQSRHSRKGGNLLGSDQINILMILMFSAEYRYFFLLKVNFYLKNSNLRKSDQSLWILTETPVCVTFKRMSYCSLREKSIYSRTIDGSVKNPKAVIPAIFDFLPLGRN